VSSDGVGRPKSTLYRASEMGYENIEGIKQGLMSSHIFYPKDLQTLERRKGNKFLKDAMPCSPKDFRTITRNFSFVPFVIDNLDLVNAFSYKRF